MYYPEAMAADPLQAIREQVEDIAGDPGLDPGERALKLQHFADGLTDTQGIVARHLGDAQLQREAQASGAARARLRARQNATIRENLLARNLATPEELDELGYLPHGELDRLQEEGLLEAALEELDEKRGELLRGEPAMDEDELVEALRGPGWLDAMDRLRVRGYELEGEPAEGEAVVLRNGEGVRIAVTFTGEDPATGEYAVESVERI